MSLYLGENKVELRNNRGSYILNILSGISVLNGIRLKTADGFVLKDINGTLLLAKEDE